MFVKLQTNFPYKSSKTLENTKEVIRSVNRRTDGTMAKKKDTMTQETKGCAT
jgi:hypothetical protein